MILQVFMNILTWIKHNLDSINTRIHIQGEGAYWISNEKFFFLSYWYFLNKNLVIFPYSAKFFL